MTRFLAGVILGAIVGFNAAAWLIGLAIRDGKLNLTEGEKICQD